MWKGQFSHPRAVLGVDYSRGWWGPIIRFEPEPLDPLKPTPSNARRVYLDKKVAIRVDWNSRPRETLEEDTPIHTSAPEQSNGQRT